MFKNNKLIMLLALNSLTAVFGNTKNASETKYDKLYNNMIKKIDTGKSNEKNYKLIENILNKRNKELKNLYLQSDYTVKPEYLEWQVLFSGFYNNRHRGGKKETSGNTVIKEAKNVDLGMVIPVSSFNRDKLDLNITKVNEHAVNVNVSSVEAPQITAPDFTAVEIDFPEEPNIKPPSGNVQNSNQIKSIGSRTPSILYKTSGNTIFDNLNVESLGNEVSLVLNGQTKNIDITGEMSYENGSYTGTSAQTYTHTNYSNEFAVHNIANNGNYVIQGNWNMRLNNGIYNQASGFLSYRPYYVNTDSKLLFSGTLTLQQDSSNPASYFSESSIGMSLALGSSTPNSNIKVIMENNGEIIIKDGTQFGQKSVAMQLEKPFPSYNNNNNTHEGELINSGYIRINTIANQGGSTAGVGIFVTISPTVNSVLVKPGKILVTGRGNKAIETGRDPFGISNIINSNINIDGTDGLITLQGENNTGIYIVNAITSTGNTFADNIKNMNILMDGENSPAITRSSAGGEEGLLDLIVNNTLLNSIEFGSNSMKSPIVYVREGNLKIESNTAGSILPINAGVRNVIAIGERNTMIKNYMPINVGSGALAMIGISTRGSFENYADINNHSSKYLESATRIYGGIGLALTGYIEQNNVNVDSTGLNKGNIDMNGDKSTAIYNVGLLLTSNNDYITAAGTDAIAVYGGGNRNTSSQEVCSNTIITTDKLEVTGDSGAVIYSKGGNISLGSNTPGGTTEVKANGKDTFAFFFQKYKPYNSSPELLGKMTLTSDVNASIENGAIAFYYQGANYSEAVDIPAYLSSIVDTSNGNLNITTDQDSYMIAVKNAQVNLSDLAGLSSPSGITFNGSGKSKLFQSNLIMDTDSNIDMNNTTGDKTYRNMEIGKSGISIKSEVTLSGTEAGQVGISQSFNYNDTKIGSSNAGTIDLKGSDSIGIYNRRAGITNEGLINISGNNGIGLYNIAGTVNNSGEIKIGSNGIGIYAETYIDPIDNPTNSSSADINNFGKITANGGDKAVGIYANKNSVIGSTSFFKIDLGDNSDIDMSASKNGIGIYSNKANVTSDSSTGNSKITVGENGVAIYAKDASVNIENFELNLNGDNSVGVYLDNTNFYGTGTVNVDGTGIVVINKVGNGTAVGGIPYYDQEFNVNSTVGSQYILQNISNDTLFYEGSSTLGEGGTFVTGKNSAVLLGQDSNIVSTGPNMIGIALNGGTGLPVTIEGEVLNQEAVNRGNISFGDNSTGIYVINGASGKNEGTIGLGENSVGLFGNGTGSSIINTGTITTGRNSAGMYLKDGNNLINTGNITGTGDRITGLYLEGNSASTVTNEGTINLSGDRSIGIYATGNGIHNINNTGTIKVGDSGIESDPSIGIYNENSNSIINNTGSIESGKTSIGIYNKGGQVNHTLGTIDAGEAGVGIYTDSGNLNLNSGLLNLNGSNTVGIYGVNNAIIDNNMLMNVSNDSFGVVLNTGSSLTNKNVSIVGNNGVLVFSDNGAFIRNESGADVTMTGSDSVGFYMANGGDIINKASITANTGNSNIGIYNKGGNINNSGDIKIGNSVIIDPLNPFLNAYAVGLYGEDTESMKNTGNMEIGSDAVGFYVKGSKTEALNEGNIISNSDKAIGIYLEGSDIRNTGNITLSGDNSIGIAAARNSSVKNAGIITMNGNDSIGIYGNANSKIVNESSGKIYINGNDSIGVQLSGGSVLENYGVIEVSSGTIGSSQIVEGSTSYTPPSIINAGIIKVDEKFELNGMNIIIKADSASFRAPTLEEIAAGGYSPSDIDAGFLLTNDVSISAPSFDFGDNPIGIDGNFTQGTNARVYKFENVFDPTTPEGGPNTGEIAIKSGSLTFDAIPVVNETGKIDVWMEKINYDKFTQGAWYDSFAKNIEGNYLNATGEALKLYDRLDLIKDADDLRNNFSELSGSMYANITQREEDIYGVLNNALYTLQNSDNNTKENIKINVISGKGSTKENTSGIDSYDYNTYGVLALREVERTYRHKFGYSLGYTRTDFKINNSDNKDSADTVQLGLHNKYSVNGWTLKNDLLGRVSIHNNDRSIRWDDGTRSDFNSDYNVYGASLLNEAGREINLGSGVKLTPYAGLELGYMAHEGFKEKGSSEGLEVKSNDGYTIKPNLGIRLEVEKRLGKTSDWKLKGNIGAAYEYELGNMNKKEKAGLSLIEDRYHDLAKVTDEKGKVKTVGYVGVELKERYGVYVTGEYGVGNKDKEEHKLGLSFKVSF